MAVTGNSWTTVFGALMDGAFLAEGRWGSTLEVAAPMLLVALGMVIGSKAGFFNIGQEGQLLVVSDPAPVIDGQLTEPVLDEELWQRIEAQARGEEGLR